MLGLLGGVILNLSLPQLIGSFFDGWSFKSEGAPFKVLSFFICQGIFFFLRTYNFGILGQHLVIYLREIAFNELVKLTIPAYDKLQVSDLATRLSADTQLIRDAVAIHLPVLVRYGMQVSIGGALMLYLAPFLTLLLILGVVSLLFLAILLGKWLRRTTRTQQSDLGVSTAIAEETLSQLKSIRALAFSLPFLTALFEKSHEDLFQSGKRRALASALLQSLVPFLMNCVLVFLALYSIHQVYTGSISMGLLIQFTTYGVIVATSLSFLTTSYAAFVQSYSAIERLTEHLNPSSLLPVENEDEINVLIKSPPQITVRNLSFKFPDSPKPLYENLSFEVPLGGLTVIKGPSGSGKTTLLALLLKFYPLNSGTIFYNGVSLTDISTSQLYRLCTYLPQEPHLFSLNLKENLLLGVSEDKLSLAQANLRALNLNFDLNAPIKGASGGEKQRLCLIRALLRDPALLLLDEPTAALDTENELAVIALLRSLSKDVTSIVVSHREAMIEAADTVIDLGKN
jgi:ATP-binding cassette subfamily B protein